MRFTALQLFPTKHLIHLLCIL